MNRRQRVTTILIFACLDGISIAILASRRRYRSRSPLPAPDRRILKRAYAALNLLHDGGTVSCFNPDGRQPLGTYSERVAALVADQNLNDVDLVIDATLTLPRVHPIVRLTAIGMADFWISWGTWPSNFERGLPEPVRQHRGAMAAIRSFILGPRAACHLR